jgi:hypothetical protein
MKRLGFALSLVWFLSLAAVSAPVSARDNAAAHHSCTGASCMNDCCVENCHCCDGGACACTNASCACCKSGKCDTKKCEKACKKAAKTK